jgi:hypothetical protein
MFPSLTTAAQGVAAGAASYAEQHHLRRRRNQALRAAKAKALGFYTAAFSKVSSVVADAVSRRRLDVNKDAQRAHAVPYKKTGRLMKDGEDWEVQEEFEVVEGVEEFAQRIKREEAEEGEIVEELSGEEVFEDVPLEDSVDRLVKRLEDGRILVSVEEKGKRWEKLLMPALKEDVKSGKKKRREVRVLNAVLDGYDAMFEPTYAPVLKREMLPLAGGGEVGKAIDEACTRSSQDSERSKRGHM